MSNEKIDIAIADISFLRNIVDRVEKFQSNNSPAIKLDLIIQGFVSFFAIGLLLSELLTGHSNTRLMIASINNSEIQSYGIQNIIWSMLYLTFLAYIAIYIQAKKEGEPYAEYLLNNFRYLRNVTFVSDCIIKIVAIACAIFANQPQWVAPLLFIFTADYLFQARLFRIPIRPANYLGIFCLIAAAVQFYLGSPMIIYPTLAFIGIIAISFSYTYGRYKSSLGEQ